MRDKEAIPILSTKQHSCSRKLKYGSKEVADKVASERQQFVEHEIHAYYCKYCKRYHIGRKELCLEQLD